MRIVLASIALIAGTVLLPAIAGAAFIVEPDNVVVAGRANDHFASTPAGTGFSLTATPSTAVGLLGNQSAFGNPANTTGPDRYTFSYTPGPDADNATIAAATSLGNSSATDADGAGAGLPVYVTAPQLATGLTGGATGMYKVYFTAPSSANVDASGSRFDITSDMATISLNPVVLNDGGTGPDEVTGTPYTGGASNRWLLLGTVPLTAGTTYTVTQTANSTAFVSQRAAGVMWEYVGPVPEPTTALLSAIGFLGIACFRRRTIG